MNIVDRRLGVHGALAYKAPVIAATTANITLTGEQTIDDVAVVDGDRVLVMDQNTGADNGIYVASTGDWVRAKDFNGVGDITQGTQAFVAGGTINGLTPFRVTTANPITIGTTALTFTTASPGDAANISFTPAGGISAITVQLAIEELDTEKLALAGGVMSGALDLNGVELILDADGDTSITADTDDQIDIRIAGADDFAFKANDFDALAGSKISVSGDGTAIDAAGSITFGVGADGAVYSDGTNLTIDASNQIEFEIGGTEIGHWDAGGINIVAGDQYEINETSVLSATVLGTGVVTSSLTTVGALASGSIASGFGTIATANDISTTAALTAGGDVQFGNATTGFFFQASSGRLALGVEEFAMTIGGASVGTALAIHSDDGEAAIEAHGHATGAGILSGPVIYGARSDGSEASETIVVDTDYLLSIAALGYDGTDYAQGARIDFKVDGTPGAGDMPTRIDFLTSADGSEAPGLAMSINPDNSITVTSTVDGRDLATDGTKLDGIEDNATADQSNAEIKTAYEANADTNAFTDAEQTKVGHISITQAVDLDAIETRVNALDASVILMGTWDASVGTFPGSGSAQAGESWIVSVGGTIDSEVFVANDRIVATTDNASTTVYASNWHKLDYTDAVLSVAGKTGAVTLAAGDIASGTFADALIAASNVTQHQAALTALGTIASATSITSTVFVGPLTGDVTGNASGTAATVTGGTQASITTAANLTTVGALDAGSITSNFGNIDIGGSTFDTTGAISGGAGAFVGSIDILNNGAAAGFITLEEPNGDSTVTLTSPALAASYTLTLPVDDGDSGEILSTNGSGALSWISNAAGASTGDANEWTAIQSFVTSDAGTDTVVRPAIVGHMSSDTVAAGFGVGLQFNAEVADGEDLPMAFIDAVATDVSAGSEDFDLVISLATAGAAPSEVFRITSTGTLTVDDPAGTLNALDADILKADTADVLTAGFAATIHANGDQASGTLTPDEANGNVQTAQNGGAHTLAPMLNDGTLVLLYNNAADAGALTTSGFTMVTGDDLTTTDGHEFMMYLTVVGLFEHLHITALQ